MSSWDGDGVSSWDGVSWDGMSSCRPGCLPAGLGVDRADRRVDGRDFDRHDGVRSGYAYTIDTMSIVRVVAMSTLIGSFGEMGASSVI